MAIKSELKDKYLKEVVPQLEKEFNIKNVMAVPTLEKIVVNSGIGSEYNKDKSAEEEVIEMIKQVTGQKPIVTLSKESIANFKLRKGMPNGVKVTLRGERMWDFLYKLVNITLPRVKDFRGVSSKSFDGKGNYALGIKDHTVFPEVDTTDFVKPRSLQVIVTTTARNDDEGRRLLELLGMPFTKKNK